MKQLRQREAEERRAARQQTVDVNQIPLGFKVLHFVPIDGISIKSSRNDCPQTEDTNQNPLGVKVLLSHTCRQPRDGTRSPAIRC